jgi:hypothetical protein
MRTPNTTHATTTASGHALYATRPRYAMSEMVDVSILREGNLDDSAKKKYEP